MFTLILGLESIGEAATMMIFYCFLRVKHPRMFED
jgi:hypothetical protein